MTGLASSHPGDAAIHVLAGGRGGVVAEWSEDGRDFIMPLGTFRFENGRLQILLNEADPDASTPEVVREADGTIRIRLAGLNISFDPATGLVSIPGLEGVAAQAAISSRLTVGANPEDSIASADPYGGVVAEFGFDGVVELAGGWVLDATTGTFKDPAGQTIRPSSRGSGGPVLYDEPSFDPIGNLPAIGPVDADAAAIVAALAPTPSYDRRRLIYETVAMLKAGGVWDKLDVLYLMDARTPLGSSINWKAPGSCTKAVTAARWARDRGVTGDGIYGEDTGWSPSTGGVNFTRDSCCLILDIASGALAPAVDVGVGAGLTYAARTAKGGIVTLSANDGAAQSLVALPNFGTAASPGYSGLAVHFAGRMDGATKAVAINRGAPVTIASASTAIPAGTLRLLAVPGQGAASTRRIKKLAAGAWLNDVERGVVMDAFTHWSKGVGSYLENNMSVPPVISRDVAALGDMFPQQIPSHARFGWRMIRVNYGVANRPLRSSGEGGPTYVRVSASDDGGKTWTHGFFLTHPAPTLHGALDPHIHCLPDGRALVVVPMWAPRTIWGVIIDNPLDAPANWIISEPFFLDFGFVGRPRTLPNGKVRYTANEPISFPPCHADRRGSKWCSLEFYDDVAYSRRLSYIPEVAGALSFSECTFASIPDGRVSLIFRTTKGMHRTVGEADDKTWSTPVKANFPGANTISRIDMVNSPSGRIALAAHGGRGRSKCTVYLTEPGGDGSSWPHSALIYPGGCSYFSIEPARTADGEYTGHLMVAGDAGRGLHPRLQYHNYLWTIRVNEASIVAGDPKFSIARVNR